MTVRSVIHTPVPQSALPEFTPVPRKRQRHDGWTPERQRAFIEALADTGCVSIACRMVNMSQPSYYQLRRQPGAESFRAAADAAHTLGLQVVKDEAFHRAMVGEMIPVHVGGKLMGFRRKKNDRLLMFILRHYSQDASGRKTTINYFSTRATAGAATQNPPRGGEGDRSPGTNGGGGGGALAKAEASTTTVKTVISGPDNAPTQRAADDEAAALLNAFEGVELDDEAQAEIHRALTACAERRRALADDPENDPERFFIGEAETGLYLGQLESGVEDDWVEYREDGEHLWENLGEGGEAERIDQVVTEMEERRAKLTPEEIAAEQAEHEAKVRRIREQQALPPPTEPDPDDPRLDWSNWSGDGYKAEARQADDRRRDSAAEASEREGPGRLACAEGDRTNVTNSVRDGPLLPDHSPNPQAPTPKPRKTYKKRQPKPHFTAPDEARKADAIAAVEVERRELADAEAARRKCRNGGAEG